MIARRQCEHADASDSRMHFESARGQPTQQPLACSVCGRLTFESARRMRRPPPACFVRSAMHTCAPRKPAKHRVQSGSVEALKYRDGEGAQRNKEKEEEERRPIAMRFKQTVALVMPTLPCCEATLHLCAHALSPVVGLTHQHDLLDSLNSFTHGVFLCVRRFPLLKLVDHVT